MDVLKVLDISERDLIEQWTAANTFPNVIKFIEDVNGNWIVGPEVLSDYAYDKLGNLSGTKEESLKSYLQTKSTTVVYEPKPDSDATKEVKEGTK